MSLSTPPMTVSLLSQVNDMFNTFHTLDMSSTPLFISPTHLYVLYTLPLVAFVSVLVLCALTVNLNPI